MRPIVFVRTRDSAVPFVVALAIMALAVVALVVLRPGIVTAAIGAFTVVAFVAAGVAAVAHERRTTRFAHLHDDGIRASCGLDLAWSEVSHATLSSAGGPGRFVLHEISGRRHSWDLRELRVPVQHLIEEINARAAGARGAHGAPAIA